MTSAGQPGGLGQRIAAALSDVTVHKVREAAFRNAEANQARIDGAATVLDLRDVPLGDGDTALVIAAGPSLHRQPVAETIKASGYRGTIVATESALGYCLRHDITPHLIVTVDPHATRIVRWLGDPQLTRERLEADSYFRRQDLEPRLEREVEANAELLRLIDARGHQVRAAVCSSASPAVVDRIHDVGMTPYWWNPFFDDFDLPDSLTRKIHAMNGLPCLNAGGNVGSAAWVIAAAVLEKQRIAVVGMDFGYYADTPYEKTQYFEEILALVGADRLDEVYVRLTNPHLGQEFYTDPAYLWYRDSFLEMAAQADCRTFNCTGGGILFGPSVEHLSLADFLAASAGPAA
ncbi:MAG: 6-hydroxymethylpterin diphosphokinase MptE-like protein [Vicinamibacterales bacterium]